MTTTFQTTLGMTIAGVIAITPGNAQNSTSPQLVVNATSTSFPNPGIGQCVGGSMTYPETACFPANCASLALTDWGSPTVPKVLMVPKFDPSLGTLLQVELNFEIQFKGKLCIDNQESTCCSISANPTVLTIVEANPPLPGVVIPPFDDAVVLFPPGFELGPSDGVDDCVTEMLPEADGSCSPTAGDHVNKTWDETRPKGPFFIGDPNLSVWINPDNAPQEFVNFDAFADAGFGLNSGCLNLGLDGDNASRLTIEAIYTYCPNTAPTCFDPGFVYEVDEAPAVPSAGIQINLMDWVTDDDGCIDCSTFEITKQPTWGELIPQPACSLTGDLHDDASACTACTSCTVTYIPTLGADFCGMDTIEFTVMDEKGTPLVMSCVIPITVNPVNEPPICIPGPALADVCEGDTVLVDLRPYVTDPDDGENCGYGIDLSTFSASSLCGGTLTPVNNNPGTFRFKAPTNFCGTCTIEFNVCDLAPGQEQACTGSANNCSVDIQILARNEAPICAVNPPTLAPVCEGETLSYNFRPFVVDPDDADDCGAKLDYASILPSSDCGVFAPTGGMPDGWFDFTPNAGFCGDCTVQIEACDMGQAGPCDVAGPMCLAAPCMTSITVFPKNEAPECAPGPFAALDDVFAGGTTAPIDFGAYVFDPDGIDGCGYDIDLTSITLSDDCGGSFNMVAGSPGWFTFTAPDDYCGSCIISLEICDSGVEDQCGGTGPLCLAAPCEIPIQILHANERPVCRAGPPLQKVFQGVTSEPIDFGLYVTDPDDDNSECGAGLGIDIETIMPMSDCGGRFGSVVGQPGWFTFTPPIDFCGICEITVSACDLGTPQLCTDPMDRLCTLEIMVSGVNQAPICDPTPPRVPCVDEDSSYEIDLNDFVYDPDEDTLCGDLIDKGTFMPTSDCGAVLAPVGTNTGIFLFTPPADYCGPCNITFTVRDLGDLPLADGPCTIPIDVCPVNDPPVAMDDTAQTEPGVSVIIDLCANDSDPDDATGCGCLLDCYSIQIVDGSGGFSDCGSLVRTDPDDANGDHTWTFTPAPGFEGECCFEYRIYDKDPGNGQFCDSDDATVCITVSIECDTNNQRNPSSLLLYPEYDNRAGMLTVHTVTNTSPFESIMVKMEYVDAEDCSKSDRSKLLTPNDTFTFATNTFFADQVHGYGYMYAQCGQTGPPVVFNHLIGHLMVMDGYEAIAYGMNPISFEAIENREAPMASCGHRETDHNGNGLRDMDGLEYQTVPDKILIPRFLGQTETRVSELIMIGLTGGKKFTTTLAFLIYNDNEEVFSSQYTFACWARVPLTDITNLFDNQYLATNTNNDPLELLGEPTVETGWIKIDGAVANSSSTSIQDPAFYAILVESHGENEMAADLPFGKCSQTNGSLLAKGLDGNF